MFQCSTRLIPDWWTYILADAGNCRHPTASDWFNEGAGKHHDFGKKKIRILLTVNIVRLDASHRPAPKAFCVKLHPVYTQNLDLVGCGEDFLKAIQKLAVHSTLARTS